jgi:hypothetical protein
VGLARTVPVHTPDRVPRFSDQTAEIVRWRGRAQDLLLENDLLRMSVDILRQELVEEKAKHAQ